MSYFTESLINNIDVHSTSSPVMTSMDMGQLGEKLRQARISTIASLSQALTAKKINSTTEVPLPKTSEKSSGKLEVNVVEGRNLTIADAMKSDTYCIVHYEDNTTSTLDKSEDDILPTVTSKIDKESLIKNNAFKAFEIMMSASSPKWMHRVTL